MVWKNKPNYTRVAYILPDESIRSLKIQSILLNRSQVDLLVEAIEILAEKYKAQLEEYNERTCK